MNMKLLNWIWILKTSDCIQNSKYLHVNNFALRVNHKLRHLYASCLRCIELSATCLLKYAPFKHFHANGHYHEIRAFICNIISVISTRPKDHKQSVRSGTRRMTAQWRGRKGSSHTRERCGGTFQNHEVSIRLSCRTHGLEISAYVTNIHVR